MQNLNDNKSLNQQEEMAMSFINPSNQTERGRQCEIIAGKSLGGIGGIAAGRQEHHAELQDAIYRLNHISLKAEKLYARMTGSDYPDETIKQERPCMPLVEVLRQGPTMIDNAAAEVHKMLDQIEELLF